jgi:hypothetical protein
MTYNAFTECYVEENEHSGLCCVVSKYWRIPAENKAQATRIVEIVRSAYDQGVLDNQNRIKDVLGINDPYSTEIDSTSDYVSKLEANYEIALTALTALGNMKTSGGGPDSLMAFNAREALKKIKQSG